MSIWDAVREMEGATPRPRRATPRPRRAAQVSPFWQDWARLEGVQTQRPAIERLIAQAAARHGVPFDLAIAVARAESGLDPQARSPAGAIGVMQLMPATARALGVDPHDIRQNIEGGVRYLRQLYDRFRDWRLAVAAYNAGPGAVQRYGGVPPFRETQEYVRRVFATFSPTGRLRTEEERRQAGQALMPRIQERREREQREIREILEREFGGRPPSEKELRRSPLLRLAVDIPRHVVRGALPVLPIRTTREEAAVRGEPIEAFGRFGPRVEVPLPGGQRLEVQPSLEGIIGAAAEMAGALLTGQALVRGLRAVAPGLMARLEQLPLRYALGNVSLGALVGAIQAAADLAPEVRSGRISPSEAARQVAQQAGLTGAAFGALHAGISGTLHAVRAGRVAVSQLRSLADDLRAVQRAVEVGRPEALPPVPVEQRPPGFYEAPRPRPTAAVEAEPRPAPAPEPRPAVPAPAAAEPTRPTAPAPTPARPAPQPSPAAPARPAAVPRPAPTASARPAPEPAQAAAPEVPQPAPAQVEAAPERPAAVAARPEPEAAPAERPTETPTAPPPPRASPSPPPPAQPAPEARPAPEPPLTVRQVVIRTARGSEERGRLAVVDLGDLVTSHTPEGTPRPEYVEHGGIQPRARERAASRAQIVRIAQKLDPDMVLADTPDAASGTPVVAPSAAGEPRWVVESGNARVAALQLASRRYPERYQAYVDALKERLRQAGQDPALLDRMIQEGRTPVLVRVRETGLDPAGRARFASEANEAAVLRMSPAEQAMTDAGRISDEMLSELAVGYDLAAPQNRPFVRAFLAQLSPEEQAGLLTETGELSRAGVERVRAAILARAYQDDRLLQLALEDVDPDVRNVLSVLTSLSGRVARYKGLSSQGAAWEQLDISRELAAAAVQYNRLIRESTPLETWLAQTQLFGELSDEAKAIMRLYAEHRRSQRKLASVLQAYYDIAERAGGPSDPVLPGMERPAPPRPMEVLERARAAAEAQQAVLFRATSPVPTEVKRSAFAPEGAETVKVHDIVARLQDLFSVPIRMRRMGRIRAAGFYKILPQVIRRKVYADFQTIYHELGHHLDNLLSLSETAPDQGELLALFRASGLPEGSYRTREVQLREGVAEFVRRIYTDPASAQQLAPRFWAHFWSKVGASDRLADALDQSIRDYRRWAGQSSWAMVNSMIAEAGERRGPTTPFFWRLYEEFVTDLAPLQRMLSDLGVDPKEGVNPVSLGQVMRGWVGHAEAMLERGVVDRTGRRLAPGLYEILRPIEGQLDDFRTYAVARRALELMRQGKTTGFEHLTDHLLTVAREGAQRGYDKVFENMVAWQNAMVKATLVDSGLLPEDVARRMFERHTAYVPFYRLFDEAGWSSVGSGRGLYGVRPPIRKLAGSTRPVEDPLVNILANTYAYAQAAAKQRVLTSITRLTKYKGAGAWIEEVPAPAVAQKLNVGRLLEELAGVLDLSKTELEQLLGKHGQDYVVLFSPASWPGRKELKERVLPIYDPRAGRIRWYQLHPDLHRFVTYNPSEAMANVLVRILGPIARTLRLGAVLDLGFILRNITRDQFTAAVQSRYGYIPFLDAMRGLVHALRKDEVWEMWATSGGSGSALASIDRNYLRGQLQKLFGRRSIGSQILGNASLDSLQALSELFENATRLGEFSRAIRKEAGKYGVEATWAGLSKLPAAKREEILVKAALASREVTLDFGRAGRSGRTINSISAFWNARVQGLDKLVRVFRDDPYGATLRAVTWITIPSVVLWWLNKDNPEYRELPAWRKLLFWHLPVPWWDGRVHLIPIPKPWELGLLFGGLAESLMEWLYRRDPEGIRQHMRALIAQPVNDLLMGFFPTAVQPVVEAVANYSFFRDRPIVPLSEQRLPPELQYGPWQTEASKGLAQLIKRLTGAGVSPRVIEHLVRGYTGTLGMTALGLPDIVLGGTRRSLVAPIERIPGVSAFVERPLAEPESIQRFYRRLQSMEREQAREAAELGAERLAPTPELATMRRAQRQLAELRRQMTAVQSDPTIPPDRKRRLVREITIAMIQTARAAMGLEPLQLQP